MFFSKLISIAAVSLALSIQAIAQDGARHTGSSTKTYNHSLWNGDYDRSNWEVGVGYVNKSWVCTYASGTQREDFFGDPDDKFIHGIQFGGLYTPSFDWGLGLRTGIYFEVYTSRSKWITQYCHHFSEADLYIPVHASFRIPFSEKYGLNMFGGMGFQWAMDGRYSRQVGTVWKWWRRPVPIYEDMKHHYGNGGPQKVNWQAECGLSVRLKDFTLAFTYSFGIVDHQIQNTFDEGKTYELASRSRQDKMQATVAFAF